MTSNHPLKNVEMQKSKKNTSPHWPFPEPPYAKVCLSFEDEVSIIQNQPMMACSRIGVNGEGLD
jgi:hypothetical protein